MFFFISNWLVLATFLVVFELFFQSFYLFLSFALGCVSSAIAQIYEFSFDAQLIFFSVTSLITFFILFNFAQKYLQKELDQVGNNYKSGVDALPGKHGLVMQVITGEGFSGLVKLKDGQEWSAQSIDGKIIPSGTEIIVVRVEGVRLIVAPFLKL